MKHFSNLEIYNLLQQEAYKKRASASSRLTIDPNNNIYTMRDGQREMRSQSDIISRFANRLNALFETEPNSWWSRSTMAQLEDILGQTDLIDPNTGEVSANAEKFKSLLRKYFEQLKTVAANGNQENETANYPIYETLNELRQLTEETSKKEELQQMQKLFTSVNNFASETIDPYYVSSILRTSFTDPKSGLTTSGNSMFHTVPQRLKQKLLDKPTFSRYKQQMLDDMYNGKLTYDQATAKLNDYAYGDLRKRYDTLMRRRTTMAPQAFENELNALYNDLLDPSKKYEGFGPDSAQMDQLARQIEESGMAFNLGSGAGSFKERAFNRLMGDLSTNQHYKNDYAARMEKLKMYKNLYGDNTQDFYNRIYGNMNAADRYKSYMDILNEKDNNFTIGYDWKTGELLTGNTVDGSKAIRTKLNPGMIQRIRSANLDNLEQLHDELVQQTGLDSTTVKRILLQKGYTYNQLRNSIGNPVSDWRRHSNKMHVNTGLSDSIKAKVNNYNKSPETKSNVDNYNNSSSTTKSKVDNYNNYNNSPDRNPNDKEPKPLTVPNNITR